MLSWAMLVITISSHSVQRQLEAAQFGDELAEQSQLYFTLLYLNGYLFGILSVLSAMFSLWAAWWRSRLLLLLDFVLLFTVFFVGCRPALLVSLYVAFCVT
eukprot:GHVN01058682.1.p2 GENE.GHVN01058682.1~~GHVN01058682.1.p2  ORF type:complete len:101 (-),score=0.10 GHVN01058682.1:267-569(-)